MDAQELKEHLLMEVSGAQDFRARKAAEHPDDVRNQRSAGCLSGLEANLNAMSSEHPLLKVCAALLENIYASDDESALDDFSMHLTEDETRFFGRYGFDAQESGDVEEFTRNYLALVKDLAEQSGFQTTPIKAT